MNAPTSTEAAMRQLHIALATGGSPARVWYAIAAVRLQNSTTKGARK